MVAWGFTIVEILVTVLVVALLATLLLPVFGKAMESANAAKCVSNLCQFGVAINSYAGDHNMSLPAYYQEKTDPAATWFRPGDAASYPAVGWAWEYLDPPRKLFRCPSDHTKSPRDAQKNPSPAYCSYAANIYFINRRKEDGTPENWSYKIFDAENKMLLCDGKSQSEDPEAGSEWSAQLAISREAAASMSRRHRGGANFLFGNGSVRWVPFAEAIDTSPEGYLTPSTKKQK